MDAGRNESISITGTLTDAQNFGGMIDEFARECGLPGRDGRVSPDGRRIPLNEGVCEGLAQCFDWWEKRWSMENKIGSADDSGEEDEELLAHHPQFCISVSDLE